MEKHIFFFKFDFYLKDILWMFFMFFFFSSDPCRVIEEESPSNLPSPPQPPDANIEDYLQPTRQDAGDYIDVLGKNSYSTKSAPTPPPPLDETLLDQNYLNEINAQIPHTSKENNAKPGFFLTRMKKKD